MIDSVDNLEPIMEGVLLKLDEISQKTGELVSPTPAWLSWDTTARFLKVYTNSFAD